MKKRGSLRVVSGARAAADGVPSSPSAAPANKKRDGKGTEAFCHCAAAGGTSPLAATSSETDFSAAGIAPPPSAVVSAAFFGQPSPAFATGRCGRHCDISNDTALFDLAAKLGTPRLVFWGIFEMIEPAAFLERVRALDS
jgi:hypothetical protein